MRGRSYSYSPSPPRGYSRRRRSPSPRGRYGGGRARDLPTSLLVRNLRHDCRDPRGFGFVQFVDPADAEDAKYHMDGQILLGRELTVVFAEENRKKPSEMRARDRGQSYDSRRSIYSRSPRYARTYSRSPGYYSPSPRRRRYSRSISPRGRRYRERSYSRSPFGSRSRSRSRSYSRSRSRSLDYSR
ncbi:serine/arginine-rich SC35-like splicing factor SCL33 isoform X2 [Rosa chinensis]|uniref:serine/arginine-rich SC35-like splicing factor SCL33 isoform X2 n=1 Tax=Rosa chinensis TaxID=74649 RepID=UPI001AD914A3|nr:serine/arginine-rich SC35-like splicing factor SCL33 isoform X2 [Rosa chinensis]